MLILCITGLFLTVQPANAQELYQYEIENDEAAIISAGRTVSGDVVLPSTLGGFPVTAIFDSAFYYQDDLTSVVIPEGVTVIGSDAFGFCPNLTAVTLPDSLQELGYGAFDDCEQLAFTVYGNGKYLGNEKNPYLALVAPASDTGNVTVHKNTKVISEYFRYYTNGKLSVEAGNAYFSMDSAGVLFNGDKTVLLYAPKTISGSYTVPQGVVEIGAFSFDDCKSLTAVTIPDSVTTIGDYAFDGCPELTAVSLGNQLSIVGAEVFRYCPKLTYNIYDNGEYLGSEDNPYLLLVGVADRDASEFRFHENTRVIGVEAFVSCNGLTTLTVPDSVVGIGAGAFQRCTALTALNIGKGVVAIGDGVFWYSDNLSEIVVSADNSVYSSDGHVLLNKDKTLLLQAPAGLCTYTVPDTVLKIEAEAFWSCEKLTGVTIGKGVREIGTDAFAFCTQLAELTVPGNVEIIGEYAFTECGSLTAVTLEEGVTTVGMRAFRRCRELASLTLPDSLTTIGQEAFAISDKLTTVTIPKNVSRLSGDTFSSCSALTEILVAKENPYYSSVDGVLYDKGMTRLIQAPGAITQHAVPQGVKVIGESAFYECDRLRSVILPDSVTTIEDTAFYFSGLGRVIVPASVTQIGGYAFGGSIYNVRFLGDAPAVIGDVTAIYTSFFGSKVGVYYPAGNTTWTEAAKEAICEKANWAEWKAYEITEGADTVITGESLPVTVATQADSDYFMGLYLDGKWVAPENYTLTGDTVITLTQTYQKTLRSGTHQLTLAFTDAQAITTLTVKKDLVGDLDGKNDVDEDDAIYLLQHVLIPELFPLEQNVDFDKSGSVDEDDAIFLLQHILMPELFPLYPQIPV